MKGLNSEYRLRIMKELIAAGQPLILAHIANRTHLSTPTTRYQLARMMEDGIILKHDDVGTFEPQQYFLNRSTITSLYMTFTVYLKLLQENTDWRQAKHNGDPVHDELPCLTMLLHLFLDEIETQDALLDHKYNPKKYQKRRLHYEQLGPPEASH